jgi:coenzyme PQQ biosynthesis protein PqqD
MTEGLRLGDVPRLPRGVRLRFDAVRGAHVLLAPERAFDLDTVAADVLGLVDGARSVDGIVAALAEKYAEERTVIEGDVIAMLDDLARKRVLDR